MKLDGTITIAAPPRDVWSLVIDPVSLAGCVPGMQDIQQVDDRTFEGTISAAVGPINGNFSFRSVMTRATFPGDLQVTVEGSDSVTKSRLEMDIAAALAAGPGDSTDLTYHAEIRVKGRLAILGEMVLRAAAGLMIGEVTGCIRTQLEPGRAPATPPA